MSIGDFEVLRELKLNCYQNPNYMYWLVCLCVLPQKIFWDNENVFRPACDVECVRTRAATPKNLTKAGVSLTITGCDSEVAGRYKAYATLWFCSRVNLGLGQTCPLHPVSSPSCWKNKGLQLSTCAACGVLLPMSWCLREQRLELKRWGEEST